MTVVVPPEYTALAGRQGDGHAAAKRRRQVAEGVLDRDRQPEAAAGGRGSGGSAVTASSAAGPGVTFKPPTVAVRVPLLTWRE